MENKTVKMNSLKIRLLQGKSHMKTNQNINKNPEKM